MTGPNGLACRQAFQEYLKWFLSRSKRGDILLIAESMSSYSYRAADSKLLSVYSRGGGIPLVSLKFRVFIRESFQICQID